MIIRTIKVGELRTNCYIVTSDDSKEAIIIDPGASPEKIFSAIDKDGLKPVLIVNTHAHHDHIGANDFLAKKYGIQASLSQDEFDLIKEWKSVYFFEFEGIDLENYAFGRMLHDGDVIGAEGLKFRVIQTPGHTKGSICLYGDGVLFSGDTLFAGDTGRTDFHGGNDEEMSGSIESLMELPPQTKVYPGHGKATTIENERRIYAAN